MDDEFGSERVSVLLQGLGVFAVRFLETPRSAMYRNHAHLILRPFLQVGVRQFNADVPRALDGDGAFPFLAVHVDDEAAENPRKSGCHRAVFSNA